MEREGERLANIMIPADYYGTINSKLNSKLNSKIVSFHQQWKTRRYDLVQSKTNDHGSRASQLVGNSCGTVIKLPVKFHQSELLVEKDLYVSIYNCYVFINST